MKTAIIAGASGLVGSALLPLLLDSDEYEKIISVGRKKLPIEHPKLQQIQLQTFDLTAFNTHCDHAYCCLGTTIRKAGSKEQFIKVDYDYPMELAKTAIRNGADTFTVITAIASDENSRWFYSRVKGQLENKLRQMGFQNLNIVRPSMLLGPRKEFRLGEWISKQIMVLFSWLIPTQYKAVKNSAVARCMLNASLMPANGLRYFENADILRFNT
ncbi:MAG: NAD-dependent epimerase/dehydratase family protein [Sphingomonadales bacterium]|jgi:uncharacterized protein YbjT (DUF2867 family)